MISGERVRQARELRGMTQSGLARGIGVHQSTITLVESERQEPSPDLLGQIAFQTGFPPAFFRLPAPAEFPLGSLLFRSRAATTARESTQARRYAQTLFELAQRLLSRVRPLAMRIPEVSDTPAAAAQIARANMGLSPDSPVTNLINTIERAGVVALPLPLELPNVDAFSTWVGRQEPRPVIGLFGGSPADRFRFSVAHELGHLVMHRRIAGRTARLEKEAHQFAAEFLMPEASIRDALLQPITLSTLVTLKPVWRVSMQALAMRAAELNIITPRQKTYLFQRMSARGWRRNEPGESSIGAEHPRGICQLAERYYGEAINVSRLAAESCLPEPLVNDFLNLHAGRNPSNMVLPVSRTKVIRFSRRRGA